MDTTTAHTIYRNGSSAQWREVLKAQGRSLRWLAKATGTNPRTVYAYAAWSSDRAKANGRYPSDRWLDRASIALGVRVTR